MNSKILLTLLSIISLTGCGVKAAPKKYPDQVVDSYVKGYIGGEPTPEEIERLKKDKPIVEEESPKVPTLLPQP